MTNKLIWSNLVYSRVPEKCPVLSKIIMPVCRLRHFRIDNWSIALYSYGLDKYEPCILDSGKWDGSLEEALKIGNLYLLN